MGPLAHSVQESFELVTAAGICVDTFGDEQLARKRLAERKENLPGATIQKVTVMTYRELVYRPRLAVVA